MKLLGIITFNLFLGVIFAITGTISNPSFFENFINNQILPISATIVGFNLTGVIFLISHLIQLKGDFTNTKKELQHNIYFMSILFVLILFILCFDHRNFNNYYASLIYKTIIMSLFFLQLYSVYEILRTIFSINSNDDATN
jgi:hypothetical protein